jgi:hypothetical protein
LSIPQQAAAAALRASSVNVDDDVKTTVCTVGQMAARPATVGRNRFIAPLSLRVAQCASLIAP